MEYYEQIHQVMLIRACTISIPPYSLCTVGSFRHIRKPGFRTCYLTFFGIKHVLWYQYSAKVKKCC